MEQKFIKYKEGQVNLAKLYRVSSRGNFDNNDVHAGTLVIGYSDKGKYLGMGYLRGISQSKETGEILYEIANAVEGQEYISCVQSPCLVNVLDLPFFAATSPDSARPVVGRIFKCNGELACMEVGTGTVTVSVNSIFEFTPYFKENK